ncbi:MAG: tryptophan 2,3-dioxygenase family protein, partial [Pseudomonadota bacterium]
EAERKQQTEELAATRISFECIYNREVYEQHQRKGRFRLSYPATLSALFINLYRNEPILFLPFTVLTRLIDIDEQLTAWRSSHALMAQRMLGSKIGTGGSSGHEYLRATVSRNRIFVDLFNLATFLIPRSALPALPLALKKFLGFYAAGSER